MSGRTHETDCGQVTKIEVLISVFGRINVYFDIVIS